MNTLSKEDSRLLRIVLGMYFSYMTIGLALPAIALYVQQQLGLSNLFVGLAIGAQFITTLLTRNFAGKRADQSGARQTTWLGMACCAASGLLYLASTPFTYQPAVAFVILILGRIILGFGESIILTGNLAWGIGLVDATHSGKVMSWNGMATYGALATSAPIGLWVYQTGGFGAVGLVTLLLPVIATVFIIGVPAVPIKSGKRAPFTTVIRKIWQPGLALGLQGTGFAVISSFVVLYFHHQNWAMSGFALSAFGISFVLTRIAVGSLPDRIGGVEVAKYCFVVEVIGLALLGAAPNAILGLIGAALTGAGCSMIFPSLGIIVVDRVEPQSRGTALGAYSAFQDIAYGVTGPFTGVIANHYGYRDIFFLCVIFAAVGFVVVLKMRQQHAARTHSHSH
ncbi:arabinose transporter [Vibrio nitrifigilis]|nr:arabinose transporter [Vibrio nitrifigilis]